MGHSQSQKKSLGESDAGTGLICIFSRWPPLVTNFGTKIDITRLRKEIESRFLHQTGVFEVRQFNGVIKIYLRRTLVAMATKMWKF